MLSASAMEEDITLQGSSALSNFRLRALARDVGAERVLARHEHYVAFHGGNREQFRDEDRVVLDKLLEYGEPFQDDFNDLNNKGNTKFFVSPRVGTITPWVSLQITTSLILEISNIKTTLYERVVSYTECPQAWGADSYSHNRALKLPTSHGSVVSIRSSSASKGERSSL